MVWLLAWRPESFHELLGAAVIWSMVGIAVLLVGYKLFDIALTKVDVGAELSKGNVAVAIAIAAMLLSIAIIVHAAIS